MLNVNWKQLDNLCEKLSKEIDTTTLDGIIGIPRGGLIPAVILSNKLNLKYKKYPTFNTLVVDDVCETGHTIKKYSRHPTAVLHLYETSEFTPTYHVKKIDQWVKYPWETKETSKVDYKDG